LGGNRRYLKGRARRWLGFLRSRLPFRLSRRRTDHNTKRRDRLPAGLDSL